MIVQANGENRKRLALGFAAALVAAVGTKLGEWVVEGMRGQVRARKGETSRPGSTAERTTDEYAAQTTRGTRPRAAERGPQRAHDPAPGLLRGMRCASN